LSLVRPFFRTDWAKPVVGLGSWDAGYIANRAGFAMTSIGDYEHALVAYGCALSLTLQRGDLMNTNNVLRRVSQNYSDQNMLAQAIRVNSLDIELASARSDLSKLYLGRLFLFSLQARLGQRTEAEATWRLLDPSHRETDRVVYLPGDAERHYAQFQFWNGTLQASHMASADQLATEGMNRNGIRSLHRLRGDWRLEQADWPQAATSFHDAVRMARERRLMDPTAETGLALAKHHLGQLDDPPREAERLGQLSRPAHRYLAMLWLAIGDLAEARQHALAAYQWAWADGEPYVHRYELMQATALLQQMNVAVPVLPPYGPAKHKPIPWEAGVRAAIERLRAKNDAGN
jgi:tetratricopeptide (TPR) repeat protein